MIVNYGNDKQGRTTEKKEKEGGVDATIKRYETIGLIPWVLWSRYDDQQRNK
jgi:hypothetical protein